MSDGPWCSNTTALADRVECLRLGDEHVDSFGGVELHEIGLLRVGEQVGLVDVATADCGLLRAAKGAVSREGDGRTNCLCQCWIHRAKGRLVVELFE